MKKVIAILKRLLYFLGGYLMFAIIVALIEFIFLTKLSSEKPMFFSLLQKSLEENFEAYLYISLMIFIINLIFIAIVTKILNRKLNKTKRKDD